MALITCPECNKEVSDQSSICQQCGFPVKEHLEKLAEQARIAEEEAEQERTKRIAMIVAVVFIFLIIVAANGGFK
jgi:uncharacterized membrane protein YvbJ